MKHLFILLSAFLFINVNVLGQCSAPDSMSTPTVTHARCLGSGTITIPNVYPGATLPNYYQYALYDSTNTSVVKTWQTSNTFTSVAAGTYTIRIRKICTTSPFQSSEITRAVTVNDEYIPVNITSITINYSPDINCCNGQFTVNATGRAPLQYALVTSISALDTPLSYLTPRQNSNVFDSMCADTFYVRVFDSCNNYTTQQLILPPVGGFNGRQGVNKINYVKLYACDSMVQQISLTGLRVRPGTEDTANVKFWVQWPNGTTDTFPYSFLSTLSFTAAHLDSNVNYALPFPDNITNWPVNVIIGTINACGNINRDTFIYNKPPSLSTYATALNSGTCDSANYNFTLRYNYSYQSDWGDYRNLYISNTSSTFYSLDSGTTWQPLSTLSGYRTARVTLSLPRGGPIRVLFAFCNDTIPYIVNVPENPALSTTLRSLNTAYPICNNGRIYIDAFGNALGDTIVAEMISAPAGQPLLTSTIVKPSTLLFDSLIHGTYTIRIYDTVGLGSCGRFVDRQITLNPDELSHSYGEVNAASCTGNSGIAIGSGILRDTATIQMISAPPGQPLSPIMRIATNWLEETYPLRNLPLGTYEFIIADSAGGASGCPRYDTFSITLANPVELKLAQYRLCNGNLLIEDTSRYYQYNQTPSYRMWNTYLRLQLLDSSSNIVYGGATGLQRTGTNTNGTYWEISSSVLDSLPQESYTVRVFAPNTLEPLCNFAEITISTQVSLILESSYVVTGCGGNADSAAVVAVVEGGVAPYLYYLYQDTVAASNLIATQSSAIFDGLDTGTVYYVGVSDSCGNFISYEIATTYESIDAQLLNTNSSPCEGDTVVLGVISNDEFTYQWYKNGLISLNDTLSTLTLNNISSSDSGEYYVNINVGECIIPSTAYLLDLNNCIPLPINLLSFEAHKQGGKASLNWTTSSETNNKGYGIEHSTNGKDWRQIGFVGSKSKQGYSNILLDYQYTDHTPAIGINYYRLAPTDYEGNVGYTAVRALTFGSTNNINIYPNPSNGMVYIEGMTGMNQITLSSPDGKVLHTQQTEEYKTGIDLSQYISGVYVLSVTDNNGKTTHYKIVKQ